MSVPKRIAIVGGGVAGLASAYWLSKHGFKVKLYERHREIGFNPDGFRCGEAHFVRAEEGITPPKNAISKAVKGILLRTCNKKYIVLPKKELNGTMVVLHKPKFLRFLAEIAEREGAEIITGRKIRRKQDLGDADFILDASGCPPLFKPLNRKRLGITYQETIENCNIYPKDFLEQHWLQHEMGYLWIFPKDDRTRTVNLGVGWLLNTKKRGRNAPKMTPKKFLERWKREKGVEGEIVRSTAGLVPLGYQRPLIAENIVFVGDAGIGADELTGGGILRALHNAKVLPAFLSLEKRTERAYFRMLATEPAMKPFRLFALAHIFRFIPVPRHLTYAVIFRATARRLYSEIRRIE